MAIILQKKKKISKEQKKSDQNPKQDSNQGKIQHIKFSLLDK